MKNITILIFPFLFSCTTKTEPAKPFTEAPVAVCPTVDSAHTPKLLWSTAGFDAPESVFYYDDGPSPAPVYFVSNVVGSPVGKDGKGWISTVSMEGKILKKKFAEGLNAPKGLYARKGNLWVSDIDRVVSFSTNDGKERNVIKVSDAKFLNDISFIYGNSVLISDIMTDKITFIDNNKSSAWLEGTQLESPNGLTLSGHKLLAASWGAGIENNFSTRENGRVLEVDPTTRKVKPWSEKRLGHLDGIEPDGADAVIVSDWMAGKVFRLKKNGECVTLLENLEGAADIMFVEKTRTLLVPVMGQGLVKSYAIPKF